MKRAHRHGHLKLVAPGDTATPTATDALRHAVWSTHRQALAIAPLIERHHAAAAMLVAEHCPSRARVSDAAPLGDWRRDVALARRRLDALDAALAALQIAGANGSD